jgi:hypothetical protein
MKKTAWLAAAAAMMAASPAAAQGGYVGAQYSSGESNIIIGSDDSEGWQGEGAVGFGGAGWGAQIDGSFGNTEFDGGGDGDTYSLGGHLWWSSGGWRLGGVITTSNADFGGGFDFEETSYGIEGTYDIGASAVLISSLTTGSGDIGGVVDYDTFNWDLGANFYASPNMRFGGFFGIGNVDLSGTEADSSSFGVHGEFQPWSAPVSITVGYNSFQIDDFDVDTDAFQIGARWNFGGGTLRDRDNSTPFDTNTGAINRSANIW